MQWQVLYGMLLLQEVLTLVVSQTNSIGKGRRTHMHTHLCVDVEGAVDAAVALAQRDSACTA